MGQDTSQGSLDFGEFRHDVGEGLGLRRDASAERSQKGATGPRHNRWNRGYRGRH
jgi:hypothetical protein